MKPNAKSLLHVHGGGKTAVNRDWCKSGKGAAFTLIELMVVVGIIAVVIGMGIPAIHQAWHKNAMNKALEEVREVFSTARDRAILKGGMTEVIFHPKEHRLELGGTSRPVEVGPDLDNHPPPAPAGEGTSAQIDDSITIEMLDINLSEYKDADLARIRFYPNGTSDEVTLILRSDQNEYHKLSIEVTTGLATWGDVNR